MPTRGPVVRPTGHRHTQLALEAEDAAGLGPSLTEGDGTQQVQPRREVPSNHCWGGGGAPRGSGERVAGRQGARNEQDPQGHSSVYFKFKLHSLQPSIFAAGLLLVLNASFRPPPPPTPAEPPDPRPNGLANSGNSLIPQGTSTPQPGEVGRRRREPQDTNISGQRRDTYIGKPLESRTCPNGQHRNKMAVSFVWEPCFAPQPTVAQRSPTISGCWGPDLGVGVTFADVFELGGGVGEPGDVPKYVKRWSLEIKPKRDGFAGSGKESQGRGTSNQKGRMRRSISHPLV